MKVTGLYLVRNEVDVIEVNVRHHLAIALDEAIVVDNGSSDGTLELLVELAEKLPIVLLSEPGPYRQGELTNRMAALAGERGADWVLPIDADEFWVGRDRPLREILADCPPSTGVVLCEVINYVQQRDVESAAPDSLLTMTMRVTAPQGAVEDAQRLVESSEISFVEMRYPPKCVSRFGAGLEIHIGNHRVTGVGEARPSDEILCLHAPLRSLSAFGPKLDHGRRVTELDYPAGLAWHVRRWWQLARERRLDNEWAANSWCDGLLGLGAAAKPLVEDRRLAELASPWVRVARELPQREPTGLDPVVTAYLRALPTVPGWFSELDLRVFSALDQFQKAQSITGDLLEIGAYCGKSAILMGYLTVRGEKLVVCDLFNRNDLTTDENRVENARWYVGFEQQEFEQHYLRFHASLPQLIVGPSTCIDREALAGTCRFVHVDGSHNHAIVREDIATAERVLRAGGIVALDDISTAHNPGSAVAAWEAVVGGSLHPVCLTDAKLYGCFDSDWRLWSKLIRAWAESQPDVRTETHLIAGYELLRLVHEVPSHPAPPVLPPLPTLQPPVPRGTMASTPTPYNDSFYDFVSESARSAADEIVPLLLELTGARSVVDVGCGTGTWLATFQRHGVQEILGLDGPHVNTNRLGIKSDEFCATDLERPKWLGRTFDLALSLEVAEHLSVDSAKRFVRFLTDLAPVVCFSAAIPLQGGVGHVNEQWPTYWAAHFAECGFRPVDAIRPLVWSNPKVAMWYAQNMLMFIRKDTIAALPRLASAVSSTRDGQLDLVHPSLFLYHKLEVPGMVARVPFDAVQQLAPRDVSLPVAVTPSAPTLRQLLRHIPAAATRAAQWRIERAVAKWRTRRPAS